MTQADTRALNDRHGPADAATSRAVCSVQDIPLLGARVVRRPGSEDIALFRCGDDRIFAVIDRCPHKGGPLSAGLVHGHAVTCPLHGWTIELDSGQAQAPDAGCVETVAVRVVDGVVHLAMEAQG
jgi:nitrite reductase (NADH) small subunit